MSSEQTTHVEKRARDLTRRASRQLWWETYAPSIALVLLCIFMYMIAAAAGVWQRIGDPWRLIGLIIATVFIIRNILRARKRSAPTRSQAQRRVEGDNNLPHRPLDTLSDTPAMAAQNGYSEEAWMSHLTNARAQIQHAKPSFLRPTVAPMDKYYLRLAVPAALVLALMVGFGDNYERLRSSLMPQWMSGMSANDARYEAWIDPPAYTGRPPSYFKDKDSMQAPDGAEFVARISGVKTAPRLVLRAGKHTQRITPKRLGPKSFEARVIIDAEHGDTTASYRIGANSKTWSLALRKDRFPTISFVDPPEAGKGDRLIFSYNLEDDYGVENLVLSIARENDSENTEQIPISLPGASVRSASKEPGGVDLTKHKWAGKKVIGRLIAIDGKRQVGSTKYHDFVVPDKIFVEPLAKAVAEQRQLMLVGTAPYAPYPKPEKIKPENKPLYSVDNPDLTINRAPQSVRRAALLLEVVTDKPAGVFEDPSLYMGLRNVYRHLQTARAQDELGGIPEDLWAIAVRAEFGRLGDALQDMKRAERALNNAMARRAPQREVDALFERYNQAVDRYMEFLTLKAIEEAKNKTADGQEDGGEADFQTDEIQELLDAIAEANRMGDTAAARKALAKLAKLLEQMEIQLAQGGGSGEGVGESMSEEIKEALEELNDVLGEQRRLRDETGDAARGEADEQQSGEGGDTGEQGENQNPGQRPSGKELSEKQGQIADLLQSLKDGAENGFGDKKDENGTAGGGQEDPSSDKNGSGGTDDNADENAGGGTGDDALSAETKQALKDALKEAEDAMRKSEQALRDGSYYQAGRAQSDAIDALREAGENLLKQEADRLAKDGKDGGGESDAAEGDSDPFGRDGGRGVGDEDIDLDQKSDQERARELLEELRKRAGERKRDETEREYLERLLERF